MNERIKQLAIEAGYLPDNFGIGHWDMPECKNFAELIVRECGEWVNDNLGLLDEEARADLLKHFGVEEQEKVAPKFKCSVCGTTENVRYMGGYQPYLCDSIDCIPF